jgi:hypothetical protein
MLFFTPLPLPLPLPFPKPPPPPPLSLSPPVAPLSPSPSPSPQGLTLVQFSAQPKPFRSHLPVSPCLTDWGEIMYRTYPTKCAYVEPKTGRV